MRIGVAVACAFLISAGTIFGADRADFEEIVAVDESLKTLSMSVRRGTGTPPDERLLMLNGVVSSIEVISPEEDSFRARIELVSGEWRGLEEIVMYKAYIDVSGAEFAARIPARRRGSVPENAIETNEPMLVVGRFTGVDLDMEGTPVPVVDGFYLKALR